MSIPVFSSYIRRKDMDTVLSCLVTDSIGPGEFLEKFRKLAKEVFGFDYGIFSRSPADSLALAYQALGLEKGDSVLLSALAPAYQARLTLKAGFSPVFVDVTLDDGNPDRPGVEASLSSSPLPPKAMLWSGGG